MTISIKPRARKFLALAISLGLLTSLVATAPSAFASNASVTYNSNGGTGTAPTDSTVYTAGASVTVLGSNGLSKNGFTFGGWASGGGLGPATNYQPGATFTISVDTTLTAVWNAVAVTYSVSYNGNGSTGGSVPTDSASYASGATVTVLGQNGLSRTGFTFGGWSYSGGLGPSVVTSFSIQTNTTLTAVWNAVAVTYSVSYNGNGSTGGSVPTDSASYASGATVTVLGQNGLSRTGFTFGGWSYSGGLGPSVVTSFSIQTNTTLTAVWNAVATFTMAYLGTDSTGGTPPVDPNTYPSGATVTLLGAGTLVKTGHSFGGWQDCVVNTHYGATFTITGNTTVCPIWTINPYAVHYLSTGFTSGTPPNDPNSPYASGAIVTVLGTGSLVKTGYHFGGWADFDTRMTMDPTFIILKATDLLPVWIPDLYTVTYLGNCSNSCGSVPIDGTSYSPNASVLVGAAPNANYSGFHFTGWRIIGGSVYQTGAHFAIVSNTVLTAVWVANVTYFVTYFPFQTTSGVAPVDPLSPYSSGDVVFVLGAGSLVKTGYVFNGWSNCPAINTVGTSFVIHGDTTLCSLWVIDSKFKVTYLGNGQTTGNPPPITSGSGYVAIVGNTGSMTKSGYTFSGWNTKANGLGTFYAIGFQYNRIADLTLYAIWTPAKVTYKITYDGNGNTTGTAPPQTIGAGAVLLATNSGALTKIGQHLTGWNTSSSGTGLTYNVSDSYNLLANITLYALWAPDIYSITYDGNGSTAGVIPNPSQGSGSVTLATNSGALSKNGSNYGGWNTAADGLGTLYAVGDHYILTANITLYAVWIPATYTVTYLGNGNSGGTVPIDITAYSSGGTVVVLGPNTIGKTGFTFGGWALGGVAIYPPGATFTISGDITLTAVWTANVVYTITYSGNGNSGGSVPSPTIGSGLVTLATNSGGLVKSTFTFSGWNTAVDGSGMPYSVGSQYTLNANITLYAVWIGGGITNYTITYTGNGFTSGTAPNPTVGLGSVTIAANTGSLVRSAFTFGGWNSAVDGSGMPFPMGSNYNLIADITVFAVWHPIPIPVYTITYLGNSSTSGTAPSPTVGLGSVTLATNSGSLSRNEYSFGGWNSAVDGSGSFYLVGSNYNLTANLTLYAAWTPNAVYTITYLGNGNSGGSVPSPTIGSGLVTLATNSGALVKSGFSFASWNTVADGSGTYYAVGSQYNLTANVTVFAVWSSFSTYTITYLGNGNSGGSVPSPAVGLGSVTLATNSGALVKSGFNFAGWNTSVDGSGSPYSVGSQYNLTANINLYAVWIGGGGITKYTITYLGNGYTSGSVPLPTVGLGAVTLATNSGALGKSGSKFGGWNARADGSGTPYTVGSNYTLLADITLHAVWHAVNSVYTITYLGNTNTGGVAPQPTVGAGSVNLAINNGPLVKSSSVFGGWNTSASGTGAPYAVGSGYTLLADVNLYAVWTAGISVYTITYSGNTNTGGVVPSPTVGSGSITLGANSSPLVKTAFNFGGWSTKADGTGTNYATSSNYNLTANITLYAVWSASTTYTITYLGNGNTGGTVPTPTIGSGFVVLATNSVELAKTGYTFSGWNINADRSGASYLVGSNYNLDANAILYAAYILLPIPQIIPDIIANGRIVNTSPQKKIALNQIVPVHQQFITVLPNNAVGFELYENGRLINRGTSMNVDLTQIVGPKDRVTVIAVSKDGLKSDLASVLLAKEPISLANINFNTDSYKFIGPATKILDQVAAVIIQHGYTVLEIWGYVDTQGSKASWITLSNNRAKAVKDYMTKILKGSGVLIKNAGRAQTQAVGNNNTAEGRALNRRVEIRVS